jgi:hypothetical protein
MSEVGLSHLTKEDLLAEGATLLPAKEVLSLLDLAIDLDLALDLAAPIDLAVAANANVAAPITASVSANVLSALSEATAISQQAVLIDQSIQGEAIANAGQTAFIDQSEGTVDNGSEAGSPTESLPGGDLTDTDSLLSTGLLNVDVNVAIDADLAAPIAGAVAANANVAAPIDASVAANVGSIGSQAVAVADQQAVITQQLDGVVAEATAEQDATIEQ